MADNSQSIVTAYEEGRIRKILLIRISRLGDLIWLTPAIRCLKARFPKAELHFLTNPYSAQVLAGNPYVSRVHLMDRKGVGWRIFRTAGAVSALKNARIDLVLPFRWRNEYEYLFRKIKASHLYRFSLGESAPGVQDHNADRFLFGLAPLGVKQDEKGMEVFYKSDDEARVDEFLIGHKLQDKPLVVLHSGSHQTRKMRRGQRAAKSTAKRSWPADHWAKLVNSIVKKTGVLPVLTEFSRGDMAQNDLIIQRSGVDIPRFTKQSVNRLAVLLGRADGFVCGDTGPLHVGSAVGVPTVALFGPSNPAESGPHRNVGGAVVLQKEVECIPCKGKDIRCKDNLCMQDITPEEVARELFGLMNDSGKLGPAGHRTRRIPCA